MEDRAPNVAAAAMITPHVQNLPAELTCTKRVLSAVIMYVRSAWKATAES